MVNDIARNESFEKAFLQAISEESNLDSQTCVKCLQIGESPLLALMAAKNNVQTTCVVNTSSWRFVKTVGFSNLIHLIGVLLPTLLKETDCKIKSEFSHLMQLWRCKRNRSFRFYCPVQHFTAFRFRSDYTKDPFYNENQLHKLEWQNVLSFWYTNIPRLLCYELSI